MLKSFIISDENTSSAILQLLVSIKGTQLAANKLLAAKICSSMEEDADELINCIEREAVKCENEIVHDLYEQFGEVKLEDILKP